MGLDTIDFSDPANAEHKVQLSIDCLLDCFEARKIDGQDREDDVTTAYRGTVMHGIGLTKAGRYPRKLGDEMGIQRKRAFEVNHHGLSKGFEELAVPSNKETLLIEF